MMPGMRRTVQQGRMQGQLCEAIFFVARISRRKTCSPAKLAEVTWREVASGFQMPETRWCTGTRSLDVPEVELPYRSELRGDAESAVVHVGRV
jgi:hypothetical protein